MSTSKDKRSKGLAHCRLPERGLIAIEGPDARSFLQGVISNDVTKATSNQAIWAAFLTPQGKYLHDFFLVEHVGGLLLETEAARLPDLLRRLKLYKLRSQVQLQDVSDDWTVAAVWGGGAIGAFGLGTKAGSNKLLSDGQGLALVDPRHQGLGLRVWLRALEVLPEIPVGDRADYERRRIALGLPDGSRDMEVEKAILLENGFDELAGVDWKKGCYMGQELTARTKYRGLIKKRLLPIEKKSDFGVGAADVMQGDKAVGELRSVCGRHGLALLRLQALESDQALTVGDEIVSVKIPDWVDLPQRTEAVL